MSAGIWQVLALVAAAFLLGRYLKLREIQPPGPGPREVPPTYDGGRKADPVENGAPPPATKPGGRLNNPWVVAVLVMILVNGLLFLLLGPRGGIGLFLFLPLLFGLGKKRQR